MGRMNLLDKPIVFELYPKNQDEFIDIELVGSEREQFDKMSAIDTVRYVMENYQQSASANDIYQELRDILNKGEIQIKIYNEILGVTKNKEGKIIVDSTMNSINNDLYFRVEEDELQNPYLLCEMRLFESGDHGLGRLENIIKK